MDTNPGVKKKSRNQKNRERFLRNQLAKKNLNADPLNTTTCSTSTLSSTSTQSSASSTSSSAYQTDDSVLIPSSSSSWFNWRKKQSGKTSFQRNPDWHQKLERLETRQNSLKELKWTAEKQNLVTECREATPKRAICFDKREPIPKDCWLIPDCDCQCSKDDLNLKNKTFSYHHIQSGMNPDEIKHILIERLNTQEVEVMLVERCIVQPEVLKECPTATNVITRGKERFLALVNNRPGHTCAHSCFTVAVIEWELYGSSRAKEIYEKLSPIIGNHAKEGFRGANCKGQVSADHCRKRPTCMCQGQNTQTRGLTVSYGCTSIGSRCKWSVNKDFLSLNKFKLQNCGKEMEGVLRQELLDIGYKIQMHLKQIAPIAYNNMDTFQRKGTDCKISNDSIFTTVTACLDFCAHPHKDANNIEYGLTCVLTLAKETSLPDHFQKHNLCFFKPKGAEKCGISIQLTPGSMVVESAKLEWHSTTPVDNSNRLSPSRMSLVFVQHKFLDQANHSKSIAKVLKLDRPQKRNKLD